MARPKKQTDEEVESTTAPMTDQPSKAVTFVLAKKKEMKESKYRKKFDNLVEEIDTNLVNTHVSYGEKLYERSGWGSVMTYTKDANGNTDMNVYPQKLSGRDQNRSGVPVSQEPIAFSKIITAASVLGGKLPDAEVVSDSKVFSKVSYELWKKQWASAMGNGANTLTSSFQNLFTYGWAAWRVYPKTVQVKRKGVDKIIFSDIYREAMDPKRTWLGISFNSFDFFSQQEVYYEKDISKELFMEMVPGAKEFTGKLDYCGVSQESKDENIDNQKTHLTIGYYEDMLSNRFIVHCGDLLIYDGELPNEDSYGSIVVVRCFTRDPHDPHGVGLYEMMRGNTALFTYINSLNAQQVEAEIFPILFGAQVQNGTATYRRGPNIVNPKSPGSAIDVVRTTGNVSQGIQFANQQKQDIEDNTGVNNIIAGSSSENTLGSTVIMKEAAQNRLVIPRNSCVQGLSFDAKISNSWTRQTYSVDKVFMLDSEEQTQEFVKQNPDYFMEKKPVIDENDAFKGFVVVASPNLRLNFDFDQDGNIMEDIEVRKISAKALYDEMDNYGHQTSYIEFIIDPNSMLLPSQEIQKQQYMEIYPVIQNSLTQIFAIRMQDPQAAASQLKSFEQLLKTFKESIYNYMSKKTYDEIISEQLPQQQIAMTQMNKHLNPEENGVPGQEMTQDGTDPTQPQSPEEMGSPQGALGSAVDGSLGYAASMPMTPNK